VRRRVEHDLGRCLTTRRHLRPTPSRPSPRPWPLDATAALGLSPGLRMRLLAAHARAGTDHRARTRNLLYGISRTSKLADLPDACDLASHSWQQQCRYVVSDCGDQPKLAVSDRLGRRSVPPGANTNVAARVIFVAATLLANLPKGGLGARPPRIAPPRISLASRDAAARPRSRRRPARVAAAPGRHGRLGHANRCASVSPVGVHG
jgi:hypothetical protein